MNFEIAPKETEIQANWDDAKLYCFALRINGKTGWRLPTFEELNEIFDTNHDFEKWGYWSSTEVDGSKAWFQSFGTGGQFDGAKDYDYNYVRAVRDLQ